MNDQSTYLTKEKLAEFQKELEFLTHTKRKEVAESLEYAKALGDLSENAEYHEARDQQAAVEDRIARLENILKVAVVIDGHQTSSVSLGSKITIRKEGDKEKKVFTVVSPEESDPAAGKISAKSPMGQAALGKEKGDEFSFSTPAGMMSYQILSIE